MSELILNAINNTTFCNGTSKFTIHNGYAMLNTSKGAYMLTKRDMVVSLSYSTFYTTTLWIGNTRYDVSVEVMKRTAVVTWVKFEATIDYMAAKQVVNNRLIPIGSPAFIRG